MWHERILYRPVAVALVALAVASPALYAQSGIRAGITGGIASSALEITDAKMSRGTGFVVGTSVSFPLAAQLSWITGLTYVQKGASSKDAGLTSTIDIAYLELPVLWRVALRSSRSHPFIEAGGVAATRLSCRISASSGGDAFASDCADALTGDDGESTTSATDPVGKSDFSLLIGAGMDVGSWSAGLRYERGMTNLDTSRVGSMKNRALLFTATCWIGW